MLAPWSQLLRARLLWLLEGWRLLLGREKCGLFHVGIRFGISACLGDVLPVCVDSRREVLASGSSLLGEVWAQSPWLSAAPLRLLNLLLTAGNQEGGRLCSSLVWGLDAGLLSFRKSAFTLCPLP